MEKIEKRMDEKHLQLNK
ncbi:hypothetical protein [Lederbergia lenta]|nr:hypothetical protein [Lederbergia lenta]